MPKIAVIGFQSVGKTALVKQFCKAEFPVNAPGHQNGLITNSTEFNNTNYDFWVVSGYDGYKKLLLKAIADANIVVFCFGPFDDDYFGYFRKHQHLIKHNLSAQTHCILVATVLDREKSSYLTERHLKMPQLEKYLGITFSGMHIVSVSDGYENSGAKQLFDKIHELCTLKPKPHSGNFLLKTGMVLASLGGFALIIYALVLHSVACGLIGAGLLACSFFTYKESSSEKDDVGKIPKLA